MQVKAQEVCECQDINLNKNALVFLSSDYINWILTATYLRRLYFQQIFYFLSSTCVFEIQCSQKRVVKKSLFSLKMFWISTMRWRSTRIKISHRDIMNIYRRRIRSKNSLKSFILTWSLAFLSISISTSESFSRWSISTFNKSTKFASINFVKTCISSTVSILS